MRVVRLSVRDFRGYHDASVDLGEGLTVITGPNGAGKTNLLEALYFGCTGRSCRTTNEREVVRFGERATRVVVAAEAEDGAHELSVGFAPGEPKRMRVDGANVERLVEVSERPLVSVFLPDRLELIKGAPSLRRAHLDQLVAGLWPARVATRRTYHQSLAQRNALIARIRSGAGSRNSLHSWDAQLARHGLALMADRQAAVDAIAEAFDRWCADLGLSGEPALRYRPRQPGIYHLVLRSHWAGATAISYPLPDVQVQGRAWDRFVRVDPVDHRFFSCGGTRSPSCSALVPGRGEYGNTCTRLI